MSKLTDDLIIGHPAQTDSKVYLQYSQLFDSLDYAVNKNLLGKVLTIVDSSISDQTQRKAMKDLIKESFTRIWVDSIRDSITWRFQILGSQFGDSFCVDDRGQSNGLTVTQPAPAPTV